MNIWVVGAGSIGMLLAAKLTLAGEDVTLVAHSVEQASALRERGLKLLTLDGREQHAAPQVRAFHELAADRTSSLPAPDWILLAVKQLHLTDELIEAAAGLCGPATRVLAWQNGIGHIERLLQRIPGERLDAAVTTEGAGKRSAVEIRHTGSGLTRLGSADSAYPADAAGADRQKKLASALEAAGFAVSLSNNMKEIAWNKLLVNAVINPLTAILHVRNGSLLELEPLMPLMRSLFEEGAAAARAEGIRLQDDLWEQVLEVCRRTAANASSMLQDLTAGRTTETDWVSGALLRTAERHGLELPVQAAMHRLVQSLEVKQRKGL